MSKLIYKPEALYKADINDLVEEDIAKGGVGSGVRGHKTAKKEAPKGKRGPKTIKDLLPGLQKLEDSGAGFFNRNSDGSMSIFVRGAHGNDPKQWVNARAVQNWIGYQASEIKPDPMSGHLIIRVKDVYPKGSEN